MFGLSYKDDGNKCWCFCFLMLVAILVGNNNLVIATVEQNPTNRVTQELVTTLLTSSISLAPTTAPTGNWGKKFCQTKPDSPSYIDAEVCYAMGVSAAGWNFYNRNEPYQYDDDCVDRDTLIEFRYFVALCDYAIPQSYSFALTGPVDSNINISFGMNFPPATSFYKGPEDILYKSDDSRFWVPGEYHFQYTYYCSQNQTGKIMYNLDTTFTINQYCAGKSPTTSPSKSISVVTDQPTIQYSASSSQPSTDSQGQLILYQQQNSSDDNSPFIPLRNLTESILHICIKKSTMVTVEYAPTSFDNDTILKVQFTLQGSNGNGTFKKTEWSYPYLLYGNIDTKWYGRKWVRFHPYNLAVRVSYNSKANYPTWETTISLVIDAWC